MADNADRQGLPCLDKRTALVTGGGDGIGGAISRRLAAAGARVVIAEIDRERGERTRTEIEASGGQALLCEGDIRDRATVESVASQALEYGDGAVDILVNNVGDYKPYKLFVLSDEADWETQYQYCFLHVLRCTRALLPAMLECGRGAIVNVSTVEAFRGIPGNAVYSAFKAGLVNFTRSLAVEVGGRGVRVNAIAPDLTHTPQTPMRDFHPDPEMTRCWVPLGRFAEPSDQADAVVFLASDQARFITGQTLCVDGGTSAAFGWYRTDPTSGQVEQHALFRAAAGSRLSHPIEAAVGSGDVRWARRCIAGGDGCPLSPGGRWPPAARRCSVAAIRWCRPRWVGSPTPGSSRPVAMPVPLVSSPARRCHRRRWSARYCGCASSATVLSASTCTCSSPMPRTSSSWCCAIKCVPSAMAARRIPST